jgi:hypothetical protein
MFSFLLLTAALSFSTYTNHAGQVVRACPLAVTNAAAAGRSKTRKNACDAPGAIASIFGVDSCQCAAQLRRIFGIICARF